MHSYYISPNKNSPCLYYSLSRTGNLTYLITHTVTETTKYDAAFCLGYKTLSKKYVMDARKSWWSSTQKGVKLISLDLTVQAIFETNWQGFKLHASWSYMNLDKSPRAWETTSFCLTLMPKKSGKPDRKVFGWCLRISIELVSS